MSTPRINVGKLSSRSPTYPSEAGYISSIRDQFKDLERLLGAIADQVEEMTPQIMLTALQPTFEKACVYCPKLTGDLVNSGYLEITGTGARARVEMGFAKGGTPAYGVYVHEMTEYHHAAPTRSKFLQAAMMEDLNEIFSRLSIEYQYAFAEDHG